MDRSQLRSTKQQIIGCLESLAALELRTPQLPGITKRFSTQCKAPPLDMTILRQFALHCRLLRLANAQFSIESTTRNQLAIAFLAHKLQEFFRQTITRLPAAALEKWDTRAAEDSLSKDDMSVYITRQMTHPTRLHVFQQRRNFERTKYMQKMFRQELLKSQKITMDLDVETQQELLRANLMNVDNACVTISVYQAIVRFYYLTEVRKKTIDLYAERKALDADRAVVMIQARTRGYLARKLVRQMRADEQRTLALSMEAMLFAQMAHRKAARELEALQIKNVLNAATTDVQQPNLVLTKIALSRSTGFNHHCTGHLRIPETLGEYLESVRADLFITDPLRLTREGLKRLVAGENTVKETYKQHSQEMEKLFTKLAGYGVCRAELGNAKRPVPTFDELTTSEAEIRLNRKHSFSFDLRNFLYMTAVIPHMCSGWPIKRQRRSTLLLIGAEGSGKTAWANALAHKCGSARITLTRKSLRRKNRVTCLLNYILKFLRRDEYAAVILDLMDIFDRKFEDKKSAIKNKVSGFLRMIVLEDRCLVIGISRSADLESSILDHFAHVILLKTPPDVDRLQLLADNFSRQLENDTLIRLPKRLTDVSKSTSDLTCGDVLQKVNRKFSRNVD